MSKPYRLYWVRYRGYDCGTPAGLEDLDESIRLRVAELTRPGDNAIALHLPFLDAREARTRPHVFALMTLSRSGNGIIGKLPSALSPLRDKTAWLLAEHPAWREAPREFDPEYARTWQKVSVGLQSALRRWIPEAYFTSRERFENRDVGYSMIVYSVCRTFPGRSRTEFVYDVADEEMLPNALRQIGGLTHAALAKAEARLIGAGDPGLARRYSPIWYEDVIQSVKNKPSRLISLLGDEAMLINAIIQLGIFDREGLYPDLHGIKPFSRMASLATRSVFGVDMRALVARTVDEATKLLEEAKGAARERQEKLATSRSRRGASRPLSSVQDTCGHCRPGSAVCQ